MSKNRNLANDIVPGSAIHPGILLKEELHARGMKQVDLAKQMGLAKNVMSEIINGKRNISPELAVRLETVLDISAEFWMKYQMAFEIDKIRIRNKKSVQKANISEKAKKAIKFCLNPMSILNLICVSFFEISQFE